MGSREKLKNITSTVKPSTMNQLNGKFHARQINHQPSAASPKKIIPFKNRVAITRPMIDLTIRLTPLLRLA